MAEVPWLDDEEDRAWRALRRVNLLAMAEIGRDLQADSGLSEADYEVLSTLSELPGGTGRSRELASAIRWSTSRLSHQLGRMEGRDLVVRRPAPGDGRGSLVELTDAGLDAIRRAAPHHVRSVRRHVFDHLSPEQIHHLADIAAAIVSAHTDESGTSN